MGILVWTGAEIWGNDGGLVAISKLLYTELQKGRRPFDWLLPEGEEPGQF
jgi:hypothetical protein